MQPSSQLLPSLPAQPAIRFAASTAGHPRLPPDFNPPYACEAPNRAQPGTHPPRDTHGLGGRDLAARNSRQNRGQHLPDILDRAQRRQIDPEMLCRVGGRERRRQ
jgi:hypothetical protein